MNEVDVISDEEIVKVSDVHSHKPEKVFKEPDPNILEKCTGVVIPGLRKDGDLSELLDCLKECGLPDQFELDDFHIKDYRRSKTVTILDLNPSVSVNIIKKLQGSLFAGRKISAYTLVEETPNKKILPSLVTEQTSLGGKNQLSSEKSESESSEDDYDTSYEHNEPSNGYVFENIDSFKRKAVLSPVTEPLVQSRKDRKRQKKINK